MSYQRDLLKNVQGYVPGEQPPEGARVIKLNTNENPYPPSEKALDAIRNIDPDTLRKYPNPVSWRLREIAAERFGLPDAHWVIAANGMDESLAMVLRAFVDPRDEVLTTYPTYTLYEVLCQLHGVHLIHDDLDENFQLPGSFFEKRARLCFLTRPNAPSGVAVSREDVAHLCKTFPGIVVIDEAYADFGDDNCLDFAQEYNNAIVMRSLSKSYSLAGLRVGFAFAQPALIDEFLKVKDSYNLNAVSQAAAAAALQDEDHFNACVQHVRATRERLRNALSEIGFDVPASQTNFLLARWNGSPTAWEIFEQLRARNILVRYFNARRLQNALRISIGTDEEVDALLEALKEILGE